MPEEPLALNAPERQAFGHKLRQEFKEAQPTVDGIRYPFFCHADAYKGNAQIFPPHWHDAIELIYGQAGVATVVAGGRFYAVSTGDLLFIGGRDVHAIYGDTHTRYLCARLNPELLYTTARAAFEARYVQPLLGNDAALQRLFPAKELQNTEIPVLLPRMLREFEERRYGFELAIRADLYSVFLWMLRHWHDANPAAGATALKEEQMRRMQPVLDCLSTRYPENITAEAMSHLCNLSYSAFCRTFKATLGRSFTQYLNFVRLSEAEKLLMTTSGTVTEIALACGFSDVSYFISVFRRSKGISPKQFQKQLRSVEARSSSKGYTD